MNAGSNDDFAYRQFYDTLNSWDKSLLVEQFWKKRKNFCFHRTTMATDIEIRFTKVADCLKMLTHARTHCAYFAWATILFSKLFFMRRECCELLGKTVMTFEKCEQQTTFVYRENFESLRHQHTTPHTYRCQKFPATLSLSLTDIMWLFIAESQHNTTLIYDERRISYTVSHVNMALCLHRYCLRVSFIYRQMCSVLFYK